MGKKGNFKFKLNGAGVRELLYSSEMNDVLRSYGEEIAGRTEGNYEVRVEPQKTRSAAVVESADLNTYYRNLEQNCLVKTLKGGNK